MAANTQKEAGPLYERSDVKDVEEALREIPVFDVHTHLTSGQLGARGLHDVLLYHMVVSDLYAAGCPTGGRVTEFPGVPSRSEAEQRVVSALAYLPKAANTSTVWMLRRILSDLYDWGDPITLDNWRRLDGIIAERSVDGLWADEVWARLKVVRSCTEYAKRGDGVDDHRLQYSLEKGVFSRPGRDQFDAPLQELETCWNAPLDWWGRGALDSTGPTARRIGSAGDARDAVRDYVERVPEGVLSLATHISSDIDYRNVADAEFEAALRRRGEAGSSEQSVYGSFLHELLLSELESKRQDVVFVFSIGAEALPFETGSRLSQSTVGQVGEFIARHPGLRFQCLLAARHANQSLCSLARELPNLTMVGYWWHNFYPDAIRQMISERLDMLPVNKQVGFFSDAYSVEWVYGKAALVRREMARTLGERIATGWCTLEDALAFARGILYESPRETLGMQPRER